MPINLPNMLAFERKLEVSDALMHAGVWGKDDEPKRDQDWGKIKITKRSNRSTQSSHGTEDEKKSQPNPVVKSDDANLPAGKDTLKVTFTLRVIGGLGKPFACNVPDFESAISNKVKEFKDSETGLKNLALRYAYNIANGRFLWRNRVCAEKVIIEVKSNMLDNLLIFKASSFSLTNFSKNAEDKNLTKLSSVVKQGLECDDDFVFLEVNAYVKLGDHQHVFPSQEMNIMEKEKVLFQLDSCAAIHNVKIGNALRTIDDWYDDNAEFPIAIEPYGAVTHRGQAYRRDRNDLYSLMVNWVNDRTLHDNDKNYIVANLVRGGVFGRRS